jgi:hypothetical protein
MIAGWCAMLVFIDIVRAGDKFWHVYDHVWYAAGLLAGIFFVADSQVSEHARSLQESSRRSRKRRLKASCGLRSPHLLKKWGLI